MKRPVDRRPPLPRLLRLLHAITLLTVIACIPRGPGPDPAVLSGAEEHLLASLDTANAYEEILVFSEELVTDPSGLGAGTASAGTAAEAALADHVAGKLTDLGLEVERHTYPVRVFEYVPSEVVIGSETVPSVILYGSPGTWGRRDGRLYLRGNTSGNKTIRAPLIYANAGTRSDFDAAGDVSGGIILLLRDDNATGWISHAIMEAAERGAAAVIFFAVEGEGTLLTDALRQDSVLYSNSIPAFSITRTDGERIREELKGGAVEARVSCEADEYDGRSVNVLGRIRGARFPEEIVMVSAHIDRWFMGCSDDASGVGALIELARSVVERGTPDRTILFVAVGSEEAGAIEAVDEWLTGSYALVSDRPDLFDRVVLAFNLDVVGWKGDIGKVHVSPEGASFVESLLEALALDGRLELVRGLEPVVDAWCYSSVAGATTMYADWDEEYRDYYHTDFDRCEESLLSNLGAHLQIALLAIDRADRADFPPIDFAALASWARSGYGADAILHADPVFDRLMAAVDALALAAASEGESRERIRRGGDDAIARFNAESMRIRNRLVPEILVVGETLAETRTHRYSVDAALLGEVLEALPSSGSDEADARAALERVLEIMDGGDDFQDTFPAPSWAFQFSPGTLEKINRMMETQRTWSREHRHNRETVSPGVFALHETIEEALAAPAGGWAFDAEAARSAVEEMRAAAVGRLRQDARRAAAALEESVGMLRAAVD